MVRFLLVLLLSGLWISPVLASDENPNEKLNEKSDQKTIVEKSTGTAKDKDGQLVYTEKHISQFLGDDLVHLKTEYFTRNDKKFGFISTDYKKNKQVPSYEFRDERNHRMVQVEPQKESVEVVIQLGKDEEKKKKSYKLAGNMVAGQGLHLYLRDNVDKFIKDSSKKDSVRFLIPLNEDYYDFRIKKHAGNEQTITLRIEADSWLFRIVAPHIDVTYDVKSKRLLKYEGPSNLLDENGDKMAVTIDYNYDSN